jgi:hypothetical protein
MFDSKWSRMANYETVNHETDKEWNTLNAKLNETIKR